MNSSQKKLTISLSFHRISLNLFISVTSPSKRPSEGMKSTLPLRSPLSFPHFLLKIVPVLQDLLASLAKSVPVAMPDHQLTQLTFVSSATATTSLSTVTPILAYASTVVVTLRDQTASDACPDFTGIQPGIFPVYHVPVPL